MKKDEILEYVKDRNGKLIGFFGVPFPVYVVHTSYDSLDTNPMFPLDRAILRYVKTCPKMDKTPYFANLIGFEMELVEQRIKYLKNEDMICFMLNGYRITDSAERKYLTTSSRPTVRVTGSFIVDGKTLKLLPPFVYDSDRKLYNRLRIVSAHLPIDLSMDTSPAVRVIKHLNNPVTLEMLHLENTGENFEVLGMEKRFLVGANAVFYIDDKHQFHKDIVYNGQLLQCDATGSAQTYTIELSNRKKTGDWNFVPNLGYNVSEVSNMMNKTVVVPNEGISYLLARRYDIDDFVFQVKTDETTQLPCICITEMLLKASNAPLDVIDDAAKGYVDFPVENGGTVRLLIENDIHPFVDFIKVLRTWYKGINSEGQEIVSDLKNILPDWRKWMVQFKLFDELERIDCNCFIRNK